MKKYKQQIERMRERGLSGKGITRAQAVSIGKIPEGSLPDLWAAASEVRDRFKGREIRMCSIVNAKSGRCPEDCAFCAQSSHYQTGVKTYPLKNAAALTRAGQKAFDGGSCEFSIVTSGTRVTEKDLDVIIKAVSNLTKKNPKKRVCASLGMLPSGALEKLRQAGLEHFHHNLETSRKHFAEICTTHAYDESVATVKTAAAAGLSVCCGGIFGMGESWAERVNLVWETRKLPAFSFPINFLHAIEGTPLEKLEILAPLEGLRIIAMVRLSLPERNIIICGGREHVLKQMLPLIFTAGANGLLAGGYLTTKGRKLQDDINMIKEAGFRIAE